MYTRRNYPSIPVLWAFLVSLGLVACATAAAPTPMPPTPTPTPAPVPTNTSNAFTAKYWNYVNKLLTELYGVPPVRNTDQLNSAAFLVSSTWSIVRDKAVQRLEKEKIPWDRTSPLCYLFRWYIEADIKTRAVSLPLDFIVKEKSLVESVRSLDEASNHLVISKIIGENLVTHPTEKACTEGFIK